MVWTGRSRQTKSIAAIGLLFLVACTVDRMDPVPVRSQLISRIEALLSQRSQDLEAGHLEAYSVPVDEAARPLDLQIARGAQTMPLASKTLRLNRQSISTSTFPVSEAKVNLRYQYLGLPTNNVFRIPFRYGIRSENGSLKISSIRLEADARIPGWATGSLKSQRSPHFLGISAANNHDSSRILELAEKARAALEPKLPSPLDPIVLLWSARDGNEFEQMRSQAGPSTAAQAEASVEVTPNAISVRSRQMVVNSEKLAQEGTWDQTLQHELAHLALAPRTMPITPSWVAESAALYLSGTKPQGPELDQFKNGGFDKLSFDTLSQQLQPGGHDPTTSSVSLEYTFSAAAAWYLVETFGDSAYWTFYNSFSKVPPNTIYETLGSETGPVGLDNRPAKALALQTTTKLLQRTFGLALQDLDNGVRAWIGQQK